MELLSNNAYWQSILIGSIIVLILMFGDNMRNKYADSDSMDKFTNFLAHRAKVKYIIILSKTFKKIRILSNFVWQLELGFKCQK